MTAGRIALSAALLVGSTPIVVTNNHIAPLNFEQLTTGANRFGEGGFFPGPDGIGISFG